VHRVRYEDLVSAPEKTASEICDFIGIPFDSAVLTPYEGERMRDGLHAASQAVGDPNFETHKGIEAELVDAWRGKKIGITPGQLLFSVAEELGYDLPQEFLNATGDTAQSSGFDNFEEITL